LEPAQARFLVISFSSDWLYPSYQSQEMVRALRRRNCDVAYVELQSNYGHDAFLVDVAEQTELVRGFLSSTLEKAACQRRRPRSAVSWATCSAAATTPSSAKLWIRARRCLTWVAAKANCWNGSRLRRACRGAVWKPRDCVCSAPSPAAFPC